jgi:Kef-type K+ transport system membrane component KefB
MDGSVAIAAAVIGALYFVGQAFALVNAQLVGEILVGIMMMPLLSAVGVDDAVPKTIAQIGHVGLVLLVLDGGLHIKLAQLRAVGLPALLIASVGTLLPCLLGWGFMSLLGTGPLEGFAAGTALSSTSIGMATNMLQALDLLPTALGRLICVAAMVDDVLSLVILAVLAEVSGTGSDSEMLWWAVLKPIAVSVAVIALGVVCALLTPLLFRALDHPRMGRCSLTVDSGGAPLSTAARCCRCGKHARQRVVLSAMLLLCALLTIGAGYAGSTHILGSFAAGVSFSAVPGALDLWDAHVAHISEWLASVFFCSIGAAIPIAALFQPDFLLYGLLYTVPAIAGKVFVGLFSDLCCACRHRQRLASAAGQRSDLEDGGKAESVAAMGEGEGEGEGEAGAALENKLADGASDAAEGDAAAGPPAAAMPLASAAPRCGGKSSAPTPSTVATRFAARKPAAAYFLDAQVIGWAMVGRGELGFVMAQQAHDGGLISLRSLTACVWALLLSTFLSPFAMKAALACRERAHRGRREEEEPAAAVATARRDE